MQVSMLDNCEDEMATKLCHEPVSGDMKIFTSITELNWAWKYELHKNHWQQFDCLNCMILESKWRQWKNDDTINFKIVISGKTYAVNFDKMIV